MAWIGNIKSESSNSFLSFLEYFYDTNCNIGVADEYYEILTIEKEEFTIILKNSNLNFNYNEYGIVFNLSDHLDDALKSVEYILSKNYKYE